MNITDVCKAIIGEPETVIIEDHEFLAYSLDPLEWIKVLGMNPENLPEMTEAEKAEHKETKLIPISVALRLSNKTNVQLFRQQLYVLEVTLKKNDPNFDMNLLTVRVAQELTPLFNKVMEITQAPVDVKKNPDSHN